MTDAGTDPGWGRTAAATMAQIGLEDVQVPTYARSCRGGEPGCELPPVMTCHQPDELTAAGMDPADLDRLRDLLANPHLMVLNNLVISTIGWRLAGEPAARAEGQVP